MPVHARKKPCESFGFENKNENKSDETEPDVNVAVNKSNQNNQASVKLPCEDPIGLEKDSDVIEPSNSRLGFFQSEDNPEKPSNTKVYSTRPISAVKKRKLNIEAIVEEESGFDQSANSETKYKCTICQTKFSNLNSANFKKIIFRCKMCKSCFRNASLLKKHISEGHKQDRDRLDSRDSGHPSTRSAGSSATLRSVGDWKEETSSSGKKYYYNCVTKKSQWEKPTCNTTTSSTQTDLNFREELELKNRENEKLKSRNVRLILKMKEHKDKAYSDSLTLKKLSELQEAIGNNKNEPDKISALEDKLKDANESFLDVKTKLDLQKEMARMYQKQQQQMMDILKIPQEDRSFAKVLNAVKAFQEAKEGIFNHTEEQNEVDLYDNAERILQD